MARLRASLLVFALFPTHLMPMKTDRTLTAVALLLCALTLFDAMGLIIKYLSPRYGAAELSAWRNAFGLIPSLIVLYSSREWHAKGRIWKLRQWRMALSRGVILTFAQFSFYLSLGVLTFATASTITYANSLFAVALAAVLLRENVGWIRWGAVLTGFVGVIWIVRPGSDSFSLAALLPLGAAVCYALVGVTARMMDNDVPTPLINLYSSIVALLGATALALLTGGFTPLAAPSDIWWLMAMGGFGGSAVLLLIMAYRMAEQSNLAPFNYFGIPLAFLLGWVFFDEAPWRELFPGALLILASGLLIVWREQRLKQA
ncbi:Membrane protein [Sulfitobacter guttiformis KCTC 32187]|uniref:EamA domain-containing membrane protein RarD n=2 Tax=Sulfitobacter guttiformis TaxID=74349 RepID=A0A420DSH2_9RHOB|nr:Membrane protein [Sulfitobacter guttiformis KCTC 32187]RKE97182.1 EamA domain-containing membrane protein RarD [Sulfitobacter guttiformis]